MKTYLEELEINRPHHWWEEAEEALSSFEVGREDVWAGMLVNHLQMVNPGIAEKLQGCPNTAILMAGIARLFLHIGYIKGLSDGEDRHIRDGELNRLV